MYKSYYLRPYATGQLRTTEWWKKMLRTTGNALSRTTFFHHSAILSLQLSCFVRSVLSLLIFPTQQCRKEKLCEMWEQCGKGKVCISIKHGMGNTLHFQSNQGDCQPVLSWFELCIVLCQSRSSSLCQSYCQLSTDKQLLICFNEGLLFYSTCYSDNFDHYSLFILLNQSLSQAVYQVQW